MNALVVLFPKEFLGFEENRGKKLPSCIRTIDFKKDRISALPHDLSCVISSIVTKFHESLRFILISANGMK